MADVMTALGMAPAVLAGHSMGCRVAVEAALQAPDRTDGVVLVDGSQFAAAMAPALLDTFAMPNGSANLIRRWFEEMFAGRSNPTIVASVVNRAERLPRLIGEKLLVDMLRYDVGRLATALADLHVPVVAIQSTYSNESRERRSMSRGLDMLRTRVPSIRIEIIENTGHFPQIDQSAQKNGSLDQILAALRAR
jgi:pimeloyl-ACP methyl ester carboxylesterase